METRVTRPELRENELGKWWRQGSALIVIKTKGIVLDQ
jgi:hypothetical protein